jgi:hypothetical protein
MARGENMCNHIYVTLSKSGIPCTSSYRKPIYPALGKNHEKYYNHQLLNFVIIHFFNRSITDLRSYSRSTICGYYYMWELDILNYK